MHLHDIATITTIVVHGDCPDGLASAIILHDALPSAEILFLKHGSADYENLVAKQEFIDAGSFVLDHHKSAKEYVERFGDHAHFGDEVTDPGVSGAPLCFRHVWEPVYSVGSARFSSPDKDFLLHFVALFARLAGIRDTWQRNDPDWRAACEQSNVLMFMPRQQWLTIPLRDLANQWSERFSWIGQVLYEQNENRTAKAAMSARYVKTKKGTRLAIIEGTVKTSDTAELLDQEVDLVVGFNYFEEDTPEGRNTVMALSTRSHTTFDCRKLAEYYGGGGHTKAAGFRAIVKTNDVNPYDYIFAAITQYELIP